MKTSDKMVTWPHLKIEVDTFIAEAKLKFEDLNRQDVFKKQLSSMVWCWQKVVAISPKAGERDDIYRSFETK